MKLNSKWLASLTLTCFALSACTNSQSEKPSVDPAASAPAKQESELPVDESDIGPPGLLEINAEELLSAALTAEQLEEGWIRLFDGHSLMGWFVVGNASWNIREGAIHVDKGDKSFLCTSLRMADYELQLDFQCDVDTNSGIFLRTKPQPESIETDCLELNIAPSDNPFPTGSFVQRSKLDPADLGEFDPTEWHTYRVRLVGKTAEVFLDDNSIMKLEDFESSKSGHISLQHNSGPISFKKILLRPISSQSLKLDEDWEDTWTRTVKEGAELSVTPADNGLTLKGGLGQLQSKDSYDDFFLQASYTLAKPEVNSGIFFRCLSDTILDGYECQVNHAVLNDDPLQPGDAGAGAIFRRAAARIVVGDGTTQSYVSLLAQGPQIMTWINGIQVVEFVDDREPHENPRKGLRLDAGPIALQGHDPSTEVTFHSIRITEL